MVLTSISGLSPAYGPTVGGSTVSISGSGFTGATAVYFGAARVANVDVVNDSLIYAYSPAEAAGVVDVIVISPEGTSPTTSADQFTYTAPPPASTYLSLSANPTTFGQALTLTATVSHSGYGAAPTGMVEFEDGTTVLATEYLSGAAATLQTTTPAIGAHSLSAVYLGDTANAGSNSAAQSLTVNAAVVPAVTAVSPNSGPTAGGYATVQIFGSGFTGATGVSFGGAGAGMFYVVNNGLIDVYSLPAHAAGTVDVTVTTANGTSAPSAADHYTFVAPPTAANDSYTILHDSTLSVPSAGVLANDSSPNSLPLSAVLSSSPLHGTLSLQSSGAFVYIPNALYAGTDSFTYYATDGTENSNVATVTLLVTDQAPVAAADGYSGLHDQVMTVDASTGVLANDTDPDGDNLTANAASFPTHGTLSFNADGSFTYTPTAGYVGPDGFTYTASDGILTSGTTTVSLLVTDNAPTAAAHGYAAQENGTLTIAGPGVLAGATDADGDPLTAGAVSQPQYGSLTLHSDGSFTYTPNAGYTGPDSFTYQVSDGALSASAVVSLSVNAVNAPPTANADAYTMLHDQTLTVDATAGVLANDSAPDGNPLQASIAGQAAHGTVALNADGSFTYTPAAGYTGADSFQYVASDGLAASAPATVTITITDPNAPAAVDDAYAIGRNGTLTVSSGIGVLANDADADGDTLTAGPVGTGPAHGTATLNADGSFTYTPTVGFVGTDTFQYQASDGVLTGNVATVTITVTNSAPVAANDAYSVLHDTTLVIPASGLLANDSDPDGDTLTAAAATQPQYGSLTLNPDGSFTYVPNAGYVGPDSFSYTASDGLLTSDPATVTITVKATNTPPVAVGQSYSTAHDTTLTVGAAAGLLAGATDADGDPLLATVLSGPVHGTLTLNGDGSFQYTPNAGYFGSDGFTFAAFDGTTDSAPATATLTVTNDAPTAVADAYSILAAGSTTVNAYAGVLANDIDAEDALTAVLQAGPAHGSLTLNADGSFSYTPGTGFMGSDSFTYEAYDGAQYSPAATVTLTTAPVAQPEFYQTAHDTALTVTAADQGVLTGASDADGGPMTAVWVSGPSHGSFTLNADGSFVYTPTAGYVGDDSFTYAAQESSRLSNTATVSLSVTDQAPDAPNDVFQVHAGETLTETAPGLNEVASDPDLEAISFLLRTDPSHGTLTFRADGTFVYQPTAGFVGADSFTYRTFDGALYSPTDGTVTITVEDQKPTAASAAFDVAAGGSLSTTASQSLLISSFSPEAEPLTAVLIAGPAHADQFTLNADGTFSYTPTATPQADYVGADVFTYAVTDGTLTSDPVTVALNVTDVPVPHDDSYLLNPDGSLTVSAADGVLANDFNPDPNPDQHPLTAQLANGVDPNVGTLTFNPDGSFTFLLNPNNPPPVGPITFTYKDVAAGAGAVGGAGPGLLQGLVTLAVAGRETTTLKEVDYTGALDLTDDNGFAMAKKWTSDNAPTTGLFAGWDANEPVAYVQGQTPNLQVKIDVNDPTFFTGKTVQVVGVPNTADIPTITGTATLDGGTLVVKDAKMTLPSKVEVLDDFGITWYVLPPGVSYDAAKPLAAQTGRWITAGTSHDRLYVTYKAPPSNAKLYETVVRVGTLGRVW